ncbi:hypothetical protein LNQ81_00690 [Myroides sp. M-43]|uniref:hypothetical protein n=1 Tax=Myroides oncorhynchi TaxID=2893756 RepID=UPI001E47B8BD|nr:hypothetical protein [Myroides oncorhynchi]MCC9041256.1 hypothetical protein [Myroides oncorhynchi]
MINFKINSTESLSQAFIALGIVDFKQACEYIKQLSYKRNKDRDNLLNVLEEQKGVCSTKHAVIRKLALENNHPEVELVLGIFKMDADYAPAIRATLEQAGLDYIVEGHTYLKYNNHFYDYTTITSDYELFKDKGISEVIYEYNQIGDFKINLHREAIQKWLDITPTIAYSLDKIWTIREQCIADLQL